jgi:hypothetical protein
MHDSISILNFITSIIKLSLYAFTLVNTTVWVDKSGNLPISLFEYYKQK